MALLQAMPGDFAEIAPWQARLVANRHDLEALRGIGLAYQRMKLFQTSSEFLQRALATKEVRARPETLAEILTVIGWNNLKTGNIKTARKFFERCLKEVPAHPALDVTVYGLFATHLAAGERQEAKPLLNRLEACCPDSALTQRARKDLMSPIAESR